MTEGNASKNLTPDPAEETRLLYKDWRERFIMPLLIGCVVLGVIVLIPAVQTAGSVVIKTIFIATYVITGVVTVIHFSYSIRVSVFLLIVYVLGLSELFRYGILGASAFFFF